MAYLAAADLGLLALTDSPAEARDLILACTGERLWNAEREEEARKQTRKAPGKENRAGP